MTEQTEPKPPQGLFMRIIRRLGLERQARTIRKHLGIILPGLLAVAVFGLWVVHMLRVVLRWSSFGPMFNIVLSDPEFVVRHGDSYIRSILGSVPSIEIAFFFFSLAVALLLIRWAVQGINAYRAVRERIRIQRYEHH